MKHILITTIAAVLLVGCGPSQQSAPTPETKAVEPAAEATDHSGTYSLSIDGLPRMTLELKSDGSFIWTSSSRESGRASLADNRAVGSWKVEGELLICEGTTEKRSAKIGIKFNKTSGKLNTMSKRGKEMPIEHAIPKGADGIYVKKISIHEAAHTGNIEAIKQHIAAGTDLNAKNQQGWTVNGIKRYENWGWTPLHYAKTKEVIIMLIKNGADVNAKVPGGSTRLNFAANNGDKEIAELLIAEGADMNAKDQRGMIPLHNAANEGHTEVVELLIAKGADVNTKNKYGEAPLDFATQPDNLNASAELADLLRKHGGKHGTIHGAAGGGDIEAVKDFLAADTHVNARDLNGYTPLDWAIEENKKEIPELLIANGADVNADGEIADLLRKHGGKTGEELKAEGNQQRNRF